MCTGKVGASRWKSSAMPELMAKAAENTETLRVDKFADR